LEENGKSPLICNGTIRNPWTNSGVEARPCGNATVRSGSSKTTYSLPLQCMHESTILSPIIHLSGVACRKQTSASPEVAEGKHDFTGTRYRDGIRAGQLGFDSQKGQEIFPFCPTSRWALGPTQPPIELALRGSFRGVKRLGVKLTTHLIHLFPRSRMVGAIPPHLLCLHDMTLK
jgi:hypothetical protein